MPRSIKKIMIVLRDQGATGRVFVKLDEWLPSNEMMMEAMKRLQEGAIYTDPECKLLNDDEYIEIYQEHGNGKRNEDFVFLIHRSFAQEHIISMKIM